MICDALGNYLPPTDPNMIKLLKSFDAVSADDMWANNYGDPSTRVDFMNYTEKTLELWNSYMKSYEHNATPPINPGWKLLPHLKLNSSFNASFLERGIER